MAMFTSTAEPTGGVPSLTKDQITQIYMMYLKRPPDSNELDTDYANAFKYSAAGIERSIALRAGNEAGTGIRGDEALPALTIHTAAPLPAAPPPPPPVVSQVITGFNAPGNETPPAGLYGTSNPSAPINYSTGQVGAQFGYGRPSYGVSYGGGGDVITAAPTPGGGGLFGLDPVTLVLLVGVGVAAWFLLK